MIVVITGVSGAGKTTVGLALSAATGWEFRDADDLHPPANVAKMEAGRPLTDEDRGPWLDAVADVILHFAGAGDSLVLACSALKARYRDKLTSTGADVRFVFLEIAQDVAQRRVQGRPAHFMPATLVTSQFDALERPAAALTVDASLPVDVIVVRIREWLGAGRG